VLFALVANRALDPSSKLAVARWVGRKARIGRLPEASDDACYRAMDWLHQVRAAVEKEIFHQVANLLNLEAGLLFSGTTSTYFEVDEKDEAVPRDKNGNVTDDEQKAAEGKPAGFRAYGKSAASPRTTATTCPRWSSGWRSPATASRCACGTGPAARATRR
jgi:hypothetical protein